MNGIINADTLALRSERNSAKFVRNLIKQLTV